MLMLLARPGVVAGATCLPQVLRHDLFEDGQTHISSLENVHVKEVGRHVHARRLLGVVCCELDGARELRA